MRLDLKNRNPFASVIIALALMLATIACSPQGSLTGQPDVADSRTAALGQQELVTENLPPLVITPEGTAGVDYSTSHFTVGLKEHATFDPQLAGTPAVGLRAADGPNAILRVDTEYETVTDAVAARYNLTITSQAYRDGIRLVGFALPDGANGQQIMQQMAVEFPDAIESVGFSYIWYKDATVTDPDFNSSTASSGPMWGHRRIGCATAWDFSSGSSGLRLAVIDTGVHFAHEELSSQVLDPQVHFPGEECDLHNGDNTVEDNDGHGTFIAGLMVAEGNNNRTIVGEAYRCQLIPIKVSNGLGAFDSTIANGVILAHSLGAKAINVSFGGTGFNNQINNAMNQIRNLGKLVCASAGNDGLNETNYPGGYDAVLNVGWTNTSDSRNPFSNHDSTVEIAAPGQGLKSCTPTANGYDFGQGTSFSCPLVVAAAGLIWSFDGSYSVPEVVELLKSTGQPTTGFNNSLVRRLDIGAALQEAAGVNVTAPQPTRLVYSGTIELTPTLSAGSDRVEAYLNGDLVETITSEPFDFAIDTSSISFGRADIAFSAFRGPEQASDLFSCIVDNTAPTFPAVEGFETSKQTFVPLDLKKHSNGFLENAKAIDGAQWSPSQVASGGPASWVSQGNIKFEGSLAMGMSTFEGTYGNHELDALVSRGIDLNGQSDATMVFHTRYNIEDGGSDFDRGWVYVSDGDNSFTPATFKAGGQAYFSGNQPNWSLAEIDLAAFEGETVHIVLLFESDGAGIGEGTGDDGWWVDKITIANDYTDDVPLIGSVNIDPYTLTGDIPQIGELSVDVSELHNVNSVRYILDVAPLGVINGDDETITLDAEPFSTVIMVPGVPNQIANLRIQSFDAESNTGPEITIPVYIFNLLGDVDADNDVDQTDMDAFTAKLGLTSGDVGYTPFFDADLDGRITEADASAIGYFWGSSL